MTNLTGKKEAGIARSNIDDEAVSNNVDNDDTTEEQLEVSSQSLRVNMNFEKVMRNARTSTQSDKPCKMSLTQ